MTGRVEQGIVRTGDEVEILGINAPIKTTVTGVEMFKKQLNEGQAGDNVGLLLRGIKRDDVVRGQVGIQHHAQTYQHPSPQVSRNIPGPQHYQETLHHTL